MLVRTCPSCGSTNVHRSRRRNLTEQLAALVFRRPFRCFECNNRYISWRFGKSMAPKDAKRPRKGKGRDHGEEAQA